MSKDITLSINEFRALFRKAFEGLYAHEHDFNDLANLVIWLECRGLGGISKFLEAETGMLSGLKPAMKKNIDNSFAIDGRGLSLLAFNDLVGDLAIAGAKTNQIGIAHIENAKHQDVIVASVARCARYDLAAAAWWPDSEAGIANIATQSKEGTAPMLTRINLPNSSGEQLDHITIICSSNMAAIEERYKEWFAKRGDHKIEASELTDSFSRHLDGGIKMQVDDYKQLCRCADRVLVEATEASRRGAGA